MLRSIPSTDSLSREQKVGQVLCYGWQGDTPEDSRRVNEHARALIDEMQAGSVILMGRNIGDPDSARTMIRELQSLSRVPLFVAVDQEGGTVNRFGPPLHQFPGNMALGAIRGRTGEQFASRQAEAAAKELLAVGVNWNFAPVLDVNNNPDNPIIGVRSYGGDPELVARLGAAAIHGYQEAGILACAKHFPGHGDTSVDSHLALPLIRGDRNRMDSVELVPFRAAITARVAAIMTAHIMFPALDSERPATSSPAILTGLLRDDMGYEGIVITDCLEMKAIAETIGTARAAVQSLRAGADIVLVCHTLETQMATRRAILDALDSGELPESRLNQAAGRVIDAKRRFLANQMDPDVTPWVNPEHAKLEDDIATAAITVVHRDGALPLRPAENRNIHVVSAHPAGERLAAQMRRHHASTHFLAVGATLKDAEMARVITGIECAAHYGDRIVVATAPREPWSDNAIDQERQAALVRKLLKIAPDLVVVALREPYDLRGFPEVTNYVCCYGYNDRNLRALADALFGAFEPTGRLPVTIPAKAAP